jgi:homoserine kinase
VIIKAPATSANLGPGFDTLGLAIDLNNEVRITPSRFFSVSIKGEGANRAKIKTNNQFINIFYNFYTKLVGKRDNFRFEFTNHIPFSRGLGSSSAVIVSAIASAYEMADIKLSKEAILNKALFYESHPDNIAPATYGGFVSSLIYKDRVISQKKEIPEYLKAVVVIPNKPISTNQSRGKLPKSLSLQKAVFNISHSTVLASAFFNEDWKVLRYASKDRIHEDIRMKNLKELFLVREIALENGALMSTLSGSGSTFFNLTYKDDSVKLRDILAKKFPKFRVEVYNFNNIGYNIIKD